MIGGYSNLNEKINQTIELISSVSEASKEEKGIVQINDTINDLDKATQVNANSATTISHLANEVAVLSSNLLAIADRAKFNERAKHEVADVDLVFNVAKLKNDHIKFKNTNFDKAGQNTTSWQVTKSTECELGKWILESERTGKSFTKTSNWKELKKHHDEVHGSVQEYVDQNATNRKDNEMLSSISNKLDMHTNNVFKCLDQVKKDNVIEKKETKSYEPKKPTIIKPTINNDEEWESF